MDELEGRLTRLITEKYDQLNKDLFDFKDTLLLTQKKQTKIEQTIRRNNIVTMLAIGCIAFISLR